MILGHEDISLSIWTAGIPVKIGHFPCPKLTEQCTAVFCQCTVQPVHPATLPFQALGVTKLLFAHSQPLDAYFSDGGALQRVPQKSGICLLVKNIKLRDLEN